MARGVNKVIIVGHLGSDPAMSSMPNGNAVVNVSIATTDSWKDKQTGETVERTEWHRVVFFGKLAEIVGQYLKKGSQVYVEGRLATRKWTDKTSGQDRYSTEIIVDMGGQMKMLGGGGDQHQQQSFQKPKPQQTNQGQKKSSDTGYEAGAHQAPTQTDPKPGDAVDSFDDDIPF